MSTRSSCKKKNTSLIPESLRNCLSTKLKQGSELVLNYLANVGSGHYSGGGGGEGQFLMHV
jgi:hypothetical protein